MEKQTDAKSKSNREHAPRKRQRPQEPPKFYSKNYLRRYNHGSEPRGSTPSPTATGKKNSTNDQGAAAVAASTASTAASTASSRSQQKYVYLLFHLPTSLLRQLYRAHLETCLLEFKNSREHTHTHT